MTLKAKILKRAAFDEGGVRVPEDGKSQSIRKREFERLAPLLEALAECAEAAVEFERVVKDCHDCGDGLDLPKALSILERLLSSETKERDE